MAVLKVAPQSGPSYFPEEWTHVAVSGKREGETVTTYHAIELAGKLEQTRLQLVKDSEALAERWAALEDEMLALVRPSVTLPVPEGHELLVSNRYGPQFYVAPMAGKKTKKGVIKIG
jgi:hypothetical protein